MNVGIDFDDVLFPFMRTMISWHNRVFGTIYQIESVTTYSWQEVWGWSPELTAERLSMFFQSKDHKNMSPLSGAVRGINKISECANLWVVTSRPPAVEVQTEYLLSRYLELLAGRVVYANHSLGGNGKKGDICKELKLDVFVDDVTTNIEDVSSVVSLAILFPRLPWNVTWCSSRYHNVERFDDWNQISQRISKFSCRSLSYVSVVLKPTQLHHVEDDRGRLAYATEELDSSCGGFEG